MTHAFNIRLRDKSVHGYLQKHPFLNGPNPSLNETLRKAVLESKIELAEERDDQLITFLSIEEQERIVGELSASLQVPAGISLDNRTVDEWTRDFGWKVRAIPKDAKDVLVIGSGDCKEVLFIRHRLPHANVTCADFAHSRIKNIGSALNIRFWQGHFNDALAGWTDAFDVVFSNHVLEHLYDPAETLRLIRKSLRANGCLVSALPLDGQPAVPFSAVLNGSSIHPLDFCTVDVGHGWKTNVSDLSHELRSAGFTNMNFYGRDKHFSRSEHFFPDKRAFDRRVGLGMRLNHIAFGSARGVLKKVFPREVPLFIMKVVFGIERRVWFGSNRLKNTFSVEVLVSAK